MDTFSFLCDCGYEQRKEVEQNKSVSSEETARQNVKEMHFGGLFVQGF